MTGVITNKRHCLLCGRFIEYAGVGQPRKYCDESHKSKYLKDKKRGGRPILSVEHVCPVDGTRFVAKPTAKYCSADCRIRAHWTRKSMDMTVEEFDSWLSEVGGLHHED